MKRIILYLAIGFVVVAAINIYLGVVNADQKDTIEQLMSPMPQVTPPPVPKPKGIEPSHRRQLDTPAPTEQNVV